MHGIWSLSINLTQCASRSARRLRKWYYPLESHIMTAMMFQVAVIDQQEWTNCINGTWQFLLVSETNSNRAYFSGVYLALPGKRLFVGRCCALVDEIRFDGDDSIRSLIAWNANRSFSTSPPIYYENGKSVFSCFFMQMFFDAALFLAQNSLKMLINSASVHICNFYETDVAGAHKRKWQSTVRMPFIYKSRRKI